MSVAASSLDDGIKQALSNGSCSVSTVKLLNEALFSPPVVVAPAAKVRTKSKHSRTVSRSQKPVTTAESAVSLASKSVDRYKLAVEVINSTLRGLSDAVKKDPKVSPLEMDAPSSRKFGGTVASNPQPLHPRSMNRNDTPASVSTRTEMVEALATCCSLSISYLNSISGTPNPSGAPLLQIENAQSNLMAKLIQLGLFEMALKEAKSLKQKLVKAMSGTVGGNGAQKKTNLVGKESPTEKEPFSKLLEFKDAAAASPAFPLVAACQLGMLRCVAGLKRPELVEALLPTLSSSTPHNPLSVVRALAKCSLAKALNHLGVLNYTLLSMAPSTSVSADAMALNQKLSCTPRTALALQTKALQCVVTRATLQPELTEIANKDRDGYWELWQKYASAFARRTQDQSSKRERYTLVRDLADAVRRFLRHEVPLPLEVMRTLSNLSFESGLLSQSMEHTEEWVLKLEESDVESDCALRIMGIVRMAAIELKLSTMSRDGKLSLKSETVQRIKERGLSAARGLKTISKGRKLDLDQLMAEAGMLKRSVVSLLALLLKDGGAGSGEIEEDEEENMRRELRSVCGSINLGIVGFCCKYLAMGGQGEEQTRAIKLATSTVDAAVSTAWRGFDIRSPDQWDALEDLMRDSMSLSKSLPEEAQKSLVDMSLWEKLSSTYWQIHLLYRRGGMDKEGIRALRRSIAVLDGRPVAEIANANISLKWERLASSYMAMGDWKSAEETLLKAVAVFVDTGVLEAMGDRASGGDRIGKEFEAHSQESVVGRVLTGLVKCATRRKGGSAAALRFDDKRITTAARGMTLEWSLKLAIGVMENDGAVVRALAERLLDVYPLDEMPLRRARVVSKILGLAVDHSAILNVEEVKVLGKEIADWGREIPAPVLERDTGLAIYREDIMASCLVRLAFLQWLDGETGAGSVKEAVGIWGRLATGCSGWETLLERVEDIDAVLGTLDMLVEFSEMKGEADLKMCVLRVLITFRELESKANYDALVHLETLVGLQYLRLGYSGRSGMTMAKAQALMKRGQANVSASTILQWHLAYTEYLVNIGNLEKAEEYLDAASNILESDDDLSKAKIPGARIAKRVRINRIIADAAYVMSLLAFEKGNPGDSLAHARRCVRLNQRAWAGLESLNRSATSVRGNNLGESIAALSTSDLPQPKIQSTTLAALNAPLLWPLVSALYAGLLQVSNVYRHQGMIREAEFFLEQALKTVEAVNASPRVAIAMTLFGDLRVRSGEVDAGEDMLKAARGFIGNGRGVLELEVATGNLQRLRGDLVEECKAYQRAERYLEEIMSADCIENLGRVTEDRDELAEKIAAIELNTEPKTKPPAKRRGRPPAAKGKKTLKIPKTDSPVATVAAECSMLLKQKGSLLRLKAQNLTMQKQCHHAEALLREAASLPAGNQETVVHGLTEARHLLQEALSLAGSDPVFSVLHESTISLPSVAAARLGELSPIKRSTHKSAIATARQTKRFIEILTKARDAVFNVHTRAVTMGSSTITHSVASMLSQIIVLLSAVTNSKGRGPENPMFASYSLELHKGISLQREKIAIEAEKAVSSTPEDLSWPKAGGTLGPTRALLAHSAPFEFSNFQSDYVDIIPKTWAAVSISLSESHEELYLSRFQAGQSQLMVRLPLARHNSRDDYEELWEYDSVLSELTDILGGANITCHKAKEMTNKHSRKEWWSEREKLDARLKELLDVIEHHWLGGFKGIFCQYALHKEFMSKFKRAFDKILAKHLPSRQNKRAKRVNIDYRILELFIGLGPPGEQDLDEALVDLIYFVVDILQFHGEGNAYDEVDFDVMVLELTEALSSYHEGVSFHLSELENEMDHTILILDKSVHMFPWESLPCLRGHSVSRLPSLASLRDRILMMYEKTPFQVQPGFYAEKTLGAYILNPGSDLVNTQKNFERDLATLKTWEGIVNRAPSEEEFRRNLEERDVLLYFGHGSGAHFIRARTLKKLDKCSVALLLGCSSGALKDTGEYEPYGMPVNYLLGGCPSMVATLWDVTDKDTDRFSKDVFRRWGLFTSEELVKGQRKGGEAATVGVSLVEAVAKGRESCTLKYLNGAAPVVYGIPAYLS